jgi:hypothetical protein
MLAYMEYHIALEQLHLSVTSSKKERPSATFYRGIFLTTIADLRMEIQTLFLLNDTIYNFFLG